MKFTKFNDSWKFWEVTNSFALNWAPPADARVLDLPHDAMIELPQSPDADAGANSGYRRGGVFSYSKTFIPDSPDKTYLLKIEGAYMNAFVFINGQLAAKRPYGYTVFYVPMNDYLTIGEENEIRIQVRSGAEPSSRWYPGTGLYRDVYLLEAGPSYILPDSVQVRTTRIPDKTGQQKETSLFLNTASASADIKISAEISGWINARGCSVEVCIEDADHRTVSRSSFPVGNTMKEAAVSPGPLSSSFLKSQKEALRADTGLYTFEAGLTIPSPCLWSAETPYLYTCRLLLKNAAGQILDVHTDSFGIRMLSMNPAEGFLVNAQPVKLRGTCIHHDSGMLGSKTYESVHIRQIMKLKEAGFNAIRCAHNPAAPALLRACDKVGMYVMDESFDMWVRHKSDYDYGLYFTEWWEADVEAMVKNAFNHPSVIMYSIGNEIPEIGTPQGGEIARLICEKIRSLDETRYTLASINGIFAVGDHLGQIVSDTAAELSSQGKFEGNVNDFMGFMHAHMNDMVSHPIVDDVISVPSQYTDIAGYNYMGARYELDASIHPDRMIVGSETGIMDIAYNWPIVKKLPTVIGDFCWTGWDYLGEVGIGYPKYAGTSNPFNDPVYPMQTSSTGDIDITGYRLPMSYYREIIFGLRKDPYIAVQDPSHYGEAMIQNPWVMTNAISGWSFDGIEGKPVVVEIYSDAEEVELFKNGVSEGRKPAGEPYGYRVCFETTYEPGTLTAVSYISGAESGRTEISSAGPERNLVITQESVLCPAYKGPEPIAEECASADAAAEQTAASEVNVLSGGIANAAPAMNANQMKAAYEEASQKAKALTEQLKAAYLKPDPFAGTQAAAAPAAAPAAVHTDLVVTEEEYAGDPTESRDEVLFFTVEITDDAGILSSGKEETLHVSLEGDVQLLAFGNGNPIPDHEYTEPDADTYHGRAQLILKAPAVKAPTEETAEEAAQDCTAESHTARGMIQITSDSGLKASFEIH